MGHITKHLNKCLKYLCQKGAVDEFGKKFSFMVRNGLIRKKIYNKMITFE